MKRNVLLRFPLFVACIVLFLLTNPALADLLQHWDLSEQQWKGAEVTDVSGGLKGKTRVPPSFKNGAFIVNEDSSINIPSVTAKDLPTEALSVEVWVFLKEGRKWGSFIGYFQDNGKYERGWSLGYNETAYTFWISTGGKMISIQSDRPFQLEKWTHVLATFNGEKIRLYTNGKLVAEKKAPGKIAYPDSAPYTIGAYRDKDESYPMKGQLLSAKLYDTALSAMEVKSFSKKKPVYASSGLEFAIHPAVRFLKPGSAELSWLAGPENTTEVIEFGKSKDTIKVAKSTISKTGDRRAVLSGLDPLSVYYFRIRGGESGHPRFSSFYEFNTALNFTPQIVAGKSSDQSALETVRSVLKMAGIRKGFAVIAGAPAPELALSLAKQSDFSVIGFDTDREKINRARHALYQKKSYGARVSYLLSESLESLPVTSGFADLILVGHWQENNIPAIELARILAPGRGVACLKNVPAEISRQLAAAGLNITPAAGGWITARRGKEKDSGEWTHQYGDPGNTGTSGESLGGASSTADLAVQWFGRPGADFGLDRQSRVPAPLSVNGRLFHQGMNRLIALNSYNGAVLWGMDAPHMQRLNMPRDASNWCADSENLYLAVRERAWILNAETGDRKATIPVPTLKGKPTPKGKREWGYIGRAGGVLIGSSIKPESSYRRFWAGEAWFDGKANSFGTAIICSDSLFAYSPKTFQPLWTYRNGIILNTTIAAQGKQIVFVESRNPVPKSSPGSRIASPELWKDQYLVALDLLTGKTIWEHPLDTEDGTITFYLQYAPKAVVISASNTQYHLYAFDPKTGRPLWNHTEPWASDNHSGHIQHPVILNDTIYLQPNGYDLTTGRIVTTNVGKKSGCHTYVGAKNALIYRGAGRQVAMWDTKAETVSSWPRLRPSCWLSFIPANGMLLVPEGGGGCSCGVWMETSIGFAPRKFQRAK